MGLLTTQKLEKLHQYEINQQTNVINLLADFVWLYLHDK